MEEYEFDLDALLSRLEDDESWEPDAETRQEIVFGLSMMLG